MENVARLLNAAPAQSDSRSRIPCKFFAQGRCHSGTGCPFSHAQTNGRVTSIGTPTVTTRRYPRRPQLDPRARITCRFHLQGSCSKGEKCQFVHDIRQDAKESGMRDEVGSMPENWCRELNGAWVYFADGAVVTKVTIPTDFSAVRISPLPQNTTARAVVDLLALHGFVVPEDCVNIPAPRDTRYCSAIVTVEDPHFSPRLHEVLALRGDVPQAVSVNVTVPATSYRRVDSKKVYCSWHKPIKTTWLNFGNEDIARKVGSKFSAGEFRVLDQKVQCGQPTRGKGVRNRLAWTITLSGVPALAKEKDVINDIFAKWIPRHVEIGRSSYDADLPVANASIESLLLQAAPLERWEGSPEGHGKRFKAKAWFMNDADASLVAKSFNNTPLPFHENGKLTVQLVHSARIKISTRVYDAIVQELADHVQTWEKQHLHYRIYPPARDLLVVKVEGQTSDDVIKAMGTLEKIVDGEVLMKDGKALWSDSFGTNGQTYQEMKNLERKLGILIIRDKRKSQVRLVGPQLQCKEAQQALIRLVEADSLPSTHIIELDAKQLSRAIKGGYKAIVDALGRDKAAMDITPNHRRLSVIGNKADLQCALEILQGKVKKSWVWEEGHSIGDCVICLTEAENPRRTPCNHVYCADCFESLCFAGVKSGPRIRCHGDAGNCDKTVPLTELQTHLPSAVLEDVLETAFTTYLARNSNDLKPCPSPDCTQIYRAAKLPRNDDACADAGPGSSFKCPSCYTTVCTACHVSHGGQTCAEHRDLASGGYKAMEAYKKKNGVKDCPKCGIPIQKAFGCNHMTCVNCATHICWVCLETFSESRAVYSHMGREHGGIGVEYFPNLA